MKNNIIIEELKEEYIDSIVDMLKEPEVFKYLNFAPSPEYVYREYFSSFIIKMNTCKKEKKLSKDVIFCIKDSNNNFIGLGGLNTIPFCDDVLELGYQIKKEFWHKNIGTDICKFLIEYAFKTLKVRRLYADCFSENIGSKKILLKNGFKLEGTLKDFYKKNNKLYDKLIFGLIK